MTETATAVEIVPVGQVSIYQSTDPKAQLAEASARAEVLVQVVKDQGLARTFGGNPKPHVQVEGWQFLASQFGLIPDIEWTRELDDGWEARAALRRLSDGVVIAHGDAECRRAEGNWKSRDSYAIRSMAQTRAVSKVCRIALSSVMVMAGFAATPAEEMDGVQRSGRGTPAAPVSPGDPHCPACLAVNGELVAVTYRDKKPFWKCTNPADKCAGSDTDKNGKEWAWSGWHDSFQASAEQWLTEHGYEGQVESGPQEITPGGWLANAVKALGKWSEDERRQAYKAVMEELGMESLSTAEDAARIYEAMHANYIVEHPPNPDEAPF